MRRYGAVLFLFLAVSGIAQQSPFVERLLKNRSTLTIQQGHFAGTGAQPLQELVGGAQFVMVGEDHATAQIPQFVGALCDVLAPQGFRAFAVESGQLVSAPLEQWAAQPDHVKHAAEFEKKYPDSIAFFNLQEENDLITHCSSAFSANGKFLLWGLDQEFMGASGYILTRVLETNPGKNATAALQDAVQKETQYRAKAVSTGNPGDIYMLSASDEDVSRIRDLLKTEGNATAQSLWDQFLESREIYKLNMTGQGYDSNRRRALWMKTTFLRDYEQTSSIEKKAPKVLFKFGDWHLYKGMNPLRNNDLGNFVTELADGRGLKAVNIIILAVEGPHLRFAGSGKPYRVDDSKMLDDPDYQFMKPMVENLSPEGWTIFDLRGMRKGFRSLGSVDISTERLIFGYDLLVLIPEVTAAKQIQ